jgi:arsenate reductase
MAEGWAKKLKGDVIEPYSAGIETHGLNPTPLKSWQKGVDISSQKQAS